MPKIFKDLYTIYFQKSRMFLYPHLGIKRGSSIVPIETYMCWEGVVKPEDKKLVCLYHIRDDKEFSNFEQSKLLGNKLFEQYIDLNNGKAIYIFDFSGLYPQDYEYVTEGHYSILSLDFKKRIKDFYNNDKSTQLYVDSWLNPERYYSEYARILFDPNEDDPDSRETGENLLRKSVQLCKKPDIEKETFVPQSIEI